MLSKPYNIIINRGVSAPGNDQDVVGGLNTTNKKFIFELMANMQLPGSKGYDTHMTMHSATRKYNISLEW